MPVIRNKGTAIGIFFNCIDGRRQLCQGHLAVSEKCNNDGGQPRGVWSFHSNEKQDNQFLSYWQFVHLISDEGQFHPSAKKANVFAFNDPAHEVEEPGYFAGEEMEKMKQKFKK